MHTFEKGDSDYHELLNDNFKETVKSTELLDFCYPVGSIYQSTDATSPVTIFGGSWERIQGRFLVAASDSDTDFAAANLGGTKNLVLHKHVVGESLQTTDIASGELKASKTNYTGNHEGTIQQLPPYLSVYMWKRTA